LILLSWIRIRTRIGNADPDPGARKLTKQTNKPDFQPLKMAFAPTQYAGGFKVHKIEICFGFDFEICIISLLVM
jgi:hypothetical protein